MRQKFLLFVFLSMVCAAAHAFIPNFEGAVNDHRRGDFASALKRFKPLAASGDAASQYYMGLMLANGQGVPRDEAQAAQWYAQAAQQGYAKAQNNLGQMYYHGLGVSRDPVQARDWFQKAALRQLAAAQRNLGDTYLSVDPRDQRKAVFWLRKAAAQGNDMDQFALALVYANERAVEDPVKSAYWMRKAAHQGVAAAQTYLGRYYRYGRGVAQNSASSIYWFEQAANQGDREAPYDIAQMYEQGKVIARDPVASVLWYCKAARLENGNAIYNLTNGGQAGIDCLKEVAGQGQAVAQEELGRWHENAIGDVHDYPAAAYWLRKAAEQGAGGAMTRLGDLYALGNGVPQDPVIAQMLYLLARPRTSGTHSSRIREPLSESQKNTANALANAWQEGTPLPTATEGAPLSK